MNESQEKDNKNNTPKALPPIPKPYPYNISEPFQDNGIWCFHLTADTEVLEYINNMNCILSISSGFFNRTLQGRQIFRINPRYDYEEVFVWLLEVLESEARVVILNDQWEDAILEAQSPRTDD